MEVGSCHRLRYRHTDRCLQILGIWKSVAVTDSHRKTDRQIP